MKEHHGVPDDFLRRPRDARPTSSTRRPARSRARQRGTDRRPAGDKLRWPPASTDDSDLYINDLDRAYISQTLRIRRNADQWGARRIYRMMRPGEPPTEDAVEGPVPRPVLLNPNATTSPRSAE